MTAVGILWSTGQRQRTHHHYIFWTTDRAHNSPSSSKLTHRYLSVAWRSLIAVGRAGRCPTRMATESTACRSDVARSAWSSANCWCLVILWRYAGGCTSGNGERDVDHEPDNGADKTKVGLRRRCRTRTADQSTVKRAKSVLGTSISTDMVVDACDDHYAETCITGGRGIRR